MKLELERKKKLFGKLLLLASTHLQYPLDFNKYICFQQLFYLNSDDAL